MMKFKLLIIAALLYLLMPAYGFAYDGTGIWNFTEYNASNNCGMIYTPESGEVGVLQDGSIFYIIGDDWSGQGTVSGSTYTVNDSWCEDSGTVSETITMTLTSNTAGSGSVSWTYTEGGYSCTGGHQFTLSRQSQAAPLYDATGKWNFTQSGLVDNCSDFPTPPASGWLQVTQTSNKITAVDNLGHNYKGFVNGNKYAVMRSYLADGGRTTEWGIVTLSSATQGSGQMGFVWDDNCTECWGEWNISMTKEVASSSYTIIAGALAGGSISPSGVVSVDSGGAQQFQITPVPGYLIDGILVDGSLVGASSSYTFTNVTDDHIIFAFFRLDTAACESLIQHDFNTGVVPPSGWQLLTTNQNNTWEPYQFSTEDYSAFVNYDSYNQQDEVLLSPQLNIREGILDFWSAGDPDWCYGTTDNCDLEIWIVVGSWDAGAGDDILVGTADDDWIDYDWWPSSFNLTSLLPGKPFRIGFRYKGMNGNAVYLDDIQICSDKPAVSLPFLTLLLE